MAILFVGYFGLPEKPLPPPPSSEKGQIMEGAEPWYFKGESDVAFLVCHGYQGTAFNTKPLGKFLHGLNHTAIGILLPGHGTTVEDLNQSRYYHWRNYLENVYLETRNKFRHLFLIGFSMGGTLCLDIAARNADSLRPSGIITISTPVFFNGFYNGKIVFDEPFLLFTGLVKMFFPIFKKQKIRPRSLDKTNPWVGYQSGYPLNSLHSFKLNLKNVRRGLNKISTPYCNIMAANDRTISTENQIYIYNKIQSREKRAYMFIMPPDLSTMHSLLTHERANVHVFRFLETFISDILNRPGPDDKRDSRKGFLNRAKSLVTSLFERNQPENLVDNSSR